VLVHANSGLARAEALAAEIGGRAFACDLTDIPATASAIEALVGEARGPGLRPQCRTHDDVPLAACRKRSGAAWSTSR
jgi:hypothetical protein